MLDTVRLLGYISPGQLNRNFFRRTASGPATAPFEDLESYVCKYASQDRILGTFRVGHDGYEPRSTLKHIRTENGVKEIPAIEGGQVYIEFSVPKLLWSTSLYEMGRPGLGLLEPFLSRVISKIFYSVELSDFHITRLDFAYNFDASKVLDGGNSASLLSSLAKLDFDRRQGTNYTSSHDKRTQTVLWETRDQKSRLMFYDKIAEVKKNLKELKHQRHPEGRKLFDGSIAAISDVLKGLSIDLVRCERKVARLEELKRYKIKLLSDVTVPRAKEILMDSLNRLELPMSEITEPSEIQKALEGKLSFEEIGKWFLIFQMRRELSTSDRDFVEQYGKKFGFCRDTYQRHKKLFSDVGINVKNIGEIRLKKIKEELNDRCEVWEKSSVSLNGEAKDVKTNDVEELLESLKVE